MENSSLVETSVLFPRHGCHSRSNRQMASAKTPIRGVWFGSEVLEPEMDFHCILHKHSWRLCSMTELRSAKFTCAQLSSLAVVARKVSAR